MITLDQLADALDLNLRLIQMQADGLTHSDSLLQTPYNVNSLNWILGHLAVNQDRILVLIGQEPLLSGSQTSRYETESAPIRADEEGIIKLEGLLDILTRGRALISEALPSLTPDDLALEIQIGERSTTVAQRLFGLYFHDTYHTGQTELLRQVAGKNDKIV